MKSKFGYILSGVVLFTGFSFSSGLATAGASPTVEELLKKSGVDDTSKIQETNQKYTHSFNCWDGINELLHKEHPFTNSKPSPRKVRALVKFDGKKGMMLLSSQATDSQLFFEVNSRAQSLENVPATILENETATLLIRNELINSLKTVDDMDANVLAADNLNLKLGIGLAENTAFANVLAECRKIDDSQLNLIVSDIAQKNSQFHAFEANANALQGDFDDHRRLRYTIRRHSAEQYEAFLAHTSMQYLATKAVAAAAQEVD